MNKKTILSMAAAALVLASCSSDEDLNQQDSYKDAPITVKVGVNSTNTRAGYETPDGGTAVLPSTFYLTVKQEESASSIYNYENVLMTKGEDNTYTASKALQWKGGERNPYVNAYTIEGSDVAVNTIQTTADSVALNDLLGAVSTNDGDVAVSGLNLNPSLRHLLCKLDVTFRNGTGKSVWLSRVEYQGFGLDATLDRTTGALTAGTTTGTIQPYLNDMTAEAIFAPQTSDPKIVVYEGYSAYVVRIPSSVTFQPGNRYTMNVTLGGDSPEISVQIAKEWEDVDGGDLETL